MFPSLLSTPHGHFDRCKVPKKRSNDIIIKNLTLYYLNRILMHVCAVLGLAWTIKVWSPKWRPCLSLSFAAPESEKVIKLKLLIKKINKARNLITLDKLSMLLLAVYIKQNKYSFTHSEISCFTGSSESFK